jgi:hypothetical protein
MEPDLLVSHCRICKTALIQAAPADRHTLQKTKGTRRRSTTGSWSVPFQRLCFMILSFRGVDCSTLHSQCGRPQNSGCLLVSCHARTADSHSAVVSDMTAVTSIKREYHSESMHPFLCRCRHPECRVPAETGEYPTQSPVQTR